MKIWQPETLDFMHGKKMHGLVAGCAHDVAFDGVSDDCKRRRRLVIALNAGMFAIEMAAGRLSGSLALQADALDFFGNAATCGLSLMVIGASLRVRATAALAKGLAC